MKKRTTVAKVIVYAASMAVLPVVAPAAGSAAFGAPAAPARSANTVERWDEIAATTVVKSGAFQNEGLVYMAYVSAAVYDAVTSIEGDYEPYGPAVRAPHGASAEAAAVEAAYRTLTHYFPAPRAPGSPDLAALHDAALAALPATPSTADGIAVGMQAADDIITARDGDGRQTPIGVTSSLPAASPGAGLWRRTPPAFAAPQTPWVADVEPFVLRHADQFLPVPPPSLSSAKWATAFAEIKSAGVATGSTRTPEQTDFAKFWTANVVLQYNQALRDIAARSNLSLAATARLMAMVNIIGADAGISVMHAKYHYRFWRPITAIDPTSVTDDGYGPTPGFDDGNPATAETAGWRPLLATPNHPEYPAAHGSITSAMAEVFSEVLHTNRIALDLHGFDAAGPPGNLDAVLHFETADDLRIGIVNGRLWAGLHYRFSGVAGVRLGTRVAKYDLDHAFQRQDDDGDAER